MSSPSREDSVYLAKLAEHAERYDDMVSYLKPIVNTELSDEERNLLSVAYKNVVGARRAAWRIVFSLEEKEEAKSNTQHVARIKEYRAKIEAEMAGLCNEIINILDAHQIPLAKTGESKVFYNKMKGDYLRYMAEFQSGNSKKDSAEKALVAYTTATEVGNELPKTSPTRLGLALNFSVFFYEIMNSPDRACQVAKQAFDSAMAELDTLSEDSYKDSTLIMQLLRDNLTLWTSTTNETE